MSKLFRVPANSPGFRHYRKFMVADATHMGDDCGLHETSVLCEMAAPYSFMRTYSFCPCGKYQLEWEGYRR